MNPGIELTDRPDLGRLATFEGNKNLPVYNWLYYKEAFSRDLVFDVVKSFGIKGPVLDPFCGSGTTLLACSELGIAGMGCDVSGIAVGTTLGKICKVDGDVVEMAASLAEYAGGKGIGCEISRYFDRKAWRRVCECRQRIERIRSWQVRAFFRLALVRAAIDSSYFYKDGAVLKEGKKKKEFRRAFLRHVKRMAYEKAGLEMKCPTRVFFGNAKGLAIKNGSLNAVITSPPYLSQDDYLKAYAIENWLFGKRPSGSFGTSEKEYMRDLAQSVGEISRVLEPGGVAAIVIGNAFLGRVVECDVECARMGEKAGLDVKGIYVLNRRAALVERTKKVGELRESMVVMEKP